jgi:hypothetical protein
VVIRRLSRGQAAATLAISLENAKREDLIKERLQNSPICLSCLFSAL